MNRQYLDVLVRELARHGVSDWRVDRGHHHPRLQFEWRGRSVFYVMPASPSDWRAVRNGRADLRRLLRE